MIGLDSISIKTCVLQSINYAYYTHLNITPFSKQQCIERVSELLMFNANSAVFQHGENKSIFNEMMMRSALQQTNTLSWVLYIATSLKQQSADRHVAPLGNIILIPRQPVFTPSFNVAFLVENQQITILHFWFDAIGARTHDLLHPRPPIRCNILFSK